MEVTEQTLIESLVVLHELAKNTNDSEAEAIFDREVTNRNWQGNARHGQLIVSMAVIKLSAMAAKGIMIGTKELQEAINVVTELNKVDDDKREAAFEACRSTDVDPGAMAELMTALTEIIMLIESKFGE